MSILHSIKKLGKSLIGGVMGFTLGLLVKPVGNLLTGLLPKVKVPKSLESGTSYDANARINQSRLGDTKAVVYGQAWVWPAYRSMPYKYFEAHDQILAAYLHITVGEADVPTIRIGDTLAERYKGFEFELCPPGVDMTLILPDVYTNPEVQQADLYGGALEQDEFPGPGTIGPFSDPDTPKKIVTIQAFDEGTVIFEDISFGLFFAGRITASTEGFFDDFLPDDVIGIYRSSSNDGSGYLILSISADGTSIEVFPPVSNDTDSTVGFFLQRRWVGPFPACQPGATVDKVALDFIFNALRDNDATDNERTVKIVMEYRSIDDVGDPLDAYTALEVTFTDNVNRVRRYTSEFVIDTPARIEIRVRRDTYEQRDQEDPSSACQWVGLKGYIVAKPSDAPASDPDSTRLAIKLRSSGALANQSENAVNCFVKRKVSIYDSGSWTAPVLTRLPAWAAADWMVNQSKAAITLANLNADSFVTSASKADDNEDTFDAVFDREVGLWEGSESILRVARSKPIKNVLTGLYEIYRDEPSDPVQLFVDGFNCNTGSDSIALPDADTVSGVYVTLMDPFLWTERDGPTVGTDDDPRKVQGFGLTSWDAAWREANFDYRDLRYRNHTVPIATEMEGILPLHGNRILLASAEKGWGHGGEVTDDLGSDTLQVDPPPIWTPGMDHYVYLQDVDGVPTVAIPVTQGATPDILVLGSPAGVTLRTGEGFRTIFAFGHDGDIGTDPDAPRIAIVMERAADGLRSATLKLLFDHPYVHEDPGDAPEDLYATGGGGA